MSFLSHGTQRQSRDTLDSRLDFWRPLLRFHSMSKFVNLIFLRLFNARIKHEGALMRLRKLYVAVTWRSYLPYDANGP